MRMLFIVLFVTVGGVSAHASVDPSEYLIFNFRASQPYKLRITDEIIETLEHHIMRCYVKYDKLVFGGRIARLGGAQFFEIGIAVETGEVIRENPEPIVNQPFTSFQNVSLFGNDNEFGAFFAIQNGQLFWWLEDLLGIPDMLLIPPGVEWAAPKEVDYAFCMFE